MKITNPISVTIKGSIPYKTYTTTRRPLNCNFPIRGLEWQIHEHQDCLLSTQENTFLNNHLQLVEMTVHEEVSLVLDVKKPSVFMVVMLEGFFRYYQNDLLSFYATGGATYMLFCPQSSLDLRVDKGKHSLLVIDLEKQLLQDIAKPGTKLTSLAACLSENKKEVCVLPMCRNEQQITTLLHNLRTLKVNSFTRQAEFSILFAVLLKGYSNKLESNNIFKSQLSPEIANRIFVHIQQNYYKGSNLSSTEIGQTMGIPEWKTREYAWLLFGKPLHLHIRDLRMRKVICLLEETDEPVTQIAYAVGYKSPSYFYTAFQRVFGISPLRYRENNGKK